MQALKSLKQNQNPYREKYSEGWEKVWKRDIQKYCYAFLEFEVSIILSIWCENKRTCVERVTPVILVDDTI